jgi:predicted small secreted protein
MKKSRFYLVLLALSAFALVSCRSTDVGAGGITVKATELKADPAATDGRTATLTVQFTNENLFALGYTRSTHKLYLAGTLIGQGEVKNPFGIPALNAVSHPATLEVRDPAYLRQLAGGSGANAVPYRMETVLYQTVYEDDHVIKIQSDGTLDLSAFTATP